MLPDDFGDFLQLRGGGHGARRVVGAAYHQRLGLGGDQLFYRLCGRVESRPARVQVHDLRPGQVCEGRVVDVAGLADDYLVARVQDAAEGRVHALARSDRDDYLFLGIVESPIALQIAGDFLAQLDEPPVGGVARLPLLQVVEGFFPHEPGGGKVRLADGQGNHVVMADEHLEEFADSRRRGRQHGAGKFVRPRVHQATTPSRLSLRSSTYTMSFSL